uniref:Chloride channel protein n=1 Tax=Salix viminalis TaxID=40686 RepID=A0A6N2KKH8_SALVM
MKKWYVFFFNINVNIFSCRWRSALLWRSFFTTAVVAIVLRALIDFCLSGKCGLFGKGGLIMFDVYSESVTYHLIDVLPVLTLGAIGGILGSLYNFLLDKVLRIYSRINEVLFTKFYLLVPFPFSLPVFFLDYHGLPHVNPVHLMHQKLVQQ